MNDFSNVCAAMATARGMTLETMRSLQSVPFARVALTHGISDVALARCIQIRRALDIAERVEGIQTILLIDDDMVFGPREALQVCDLSRRCGRPVSARYATADGSLAASMGTRENGTELWLTGLGFLAVPVELLRAAWESAPECQWGNEKIRAITCTGIHNGSWWSEDYRLCATLGGVVLDSAEVGHVKSRIIYPPAP